LPLASDRWIVVVALGDILSNRSRGVLPRRFCAFWPKPEWLQKETDRVYQLGPHSGFGTWNIARGALLRYPVLSPGQMTYQLRRLRLRGLITRIPGTQRYEVTDSGQRMALFWLGSMSKTIRPLATSLTDETVQQKILNEIKKTIERNAMAAANSKT